MCFTSKDRIQSVHSTLITYVVQKSKKDDHQQKVVIFYALHN